MLFAFEKKKSCHEYPLPLKQGYSGNERLIVREPRIKIYPMDNSLFFDSVLPFPISKSLLSHFVISKILAENRISINEGEMVPRFKLIFGVSK
jgi:hypothetical protein